MKFIKLNYSKYIFIILILTLTGCVSNNINNSGSKIENASEKALEKIFRIDPDSRSIYKRAAGVLIIPKVSKASFLFGGSYGEGVLKIGSATVDFYSIASASYGFQIGAQQSSHILFFMTKEALRDFRTIDGWEVGADAEVTLRDKGYSYTVSSNTITKPIYAVIFNQQGLMAGASLEGAKYSRLIRGL